MQPFHSYHHTDALQLSLQLGLPPATLLSALLRPGAAAGAGAAPGAPPPPAAGGAGSYIAAHPAFRGPLLRWLLFNGEALLGDYVAAVASGLAQIAPDHQITPDHEIAPAAAHAALDLLCAALESLARARAARGADDIRAAGFVGALLAALPRLGPLLEACRGEDSKPFMPGVA